MAMTREQKHQQVEALTAVLQENKTIYLASLEGMDATKTSELRRLCFSKDVKLQVVKNTLLQKAMEASDKEMSELYGSLKGNTALMLSEAANEPAKIIKEFTKKNKSEMPALKGAFVEESVYLGADQLNALASLKSKEELLGDIISLLQSPAQNVISALQSGGNTLAGIVKTLQEKGE